MSNVLFQLWPIFTNRVYRWLVLLYMNLVTLKVNMFLCLNVVVILFFFYVYIYVFFVLFCFDDWHITVYFPCYVICLPTLILNLCFDVFVLFVYLFQVLINNIASKFLRFMVNVDTHTRAMHFSHFCFFCS